MKICGLNQPTLKQARPEARFCHLLQTTFEFSLEEPLVWIDNGIFSPHLPSLYHHSLFSTIETNKLLWQDGEGRLTSLFPECLSPSSSSFQFQVRDPSQPHQLQQQGCISEVQLGKKWKQRNTFVEEPVSSYKWTSNAQDYKTAFSKKQRLITTHQKLHIFQVSPTASFCF